MRTPRTSLLLLASAAALAVSPHFRAQGSGLPTDVPGVGEAGGPLTDLPPAEREQWLRGRALFDHPFHRSEGVGSMEMNADSCRGCHQDPVLGGAGGLELNVSRFGRVTVGPTGPQFSNLPGGQIASRLRPPFFDGREEYGATANVFEQRQTPSLLGLGLLDRIPEAEILSREDPTDADADGIRGVARMVTIGAATEVGRFGWKAQLPRLRDFVNDALGGELGLTSPDDGRGAAMLADVDGVADPEVDTAGVDDLLFFMANLAPPPRTGSLDPQVTMGELLFEQIGCVKCHVPVLNGPDGPVAAYTNLLLHDVMGGGFSGMAEPGARSGLYRTPPLWGIGGTAPYMHDGRAETLRDAIEAHAGEALDVRAAFRALSALDEEAVLAFLEDL